MPATPPVHPVSGDPDDTEGLDGAIRTLLLVLPRAVGRIKRLEVPGELREMALAPRHLSLLSFLLLDGPMTVRELADRLEVAPTTASLLVGELSRKGVLDRREDAHDRRRRIVSIPESARPALEQWLAPGARAWRTALTPLSPAERRAVVRAFTAYEAALAESDGS
ncbi:DNA-binding transcriptional regulator, MarR family [Streptomyces zhaozhouensis]|uniref:DNA-binding transcriptional regulator, MarR family n=1 Tax=Streptomyces zhaozhouensis TaxID=1300267 RepID=A0A286DNZ1_9ACTN|nr:MarR family winged helix-turn-helix transcriptional regulator [Streptomyces zhaozhouensis]SOD60356.1 DNA-binding transcriptional regulator, MarR family [Streptomyces zhaozhouensis]